MSVKKKRLEILCMKKSMESCLLQFHLFFYLKFVYVSANKCGTKITKCAFWWHCCSTTRACPSVCQICPQDRQKLLDYPLRVYWNIVLLLININVLVIVLCSTKQGYIIWGKLSFSNFGPGRFILITCFIYVISCVFLPISCPCGGSNYAENSLTLYITKHHTE